MTVPPQRRPTRLAVLTGCALVALSFTAGVVIGSGDDDPADARLRGATADGVQPDERAGAAQPLSAFETSITALLTSLGEDLAAGDYVLPSCDAAYDLLYQAPSGGESVPEHLADWHVVLKHEILDICVLGDGYERCTEDELISVSIQPCSWIATEAESELRDVWLVWDALAKLGSS